MNHQCTIAQPTPAVEPRLSRAAPHCCGRASQMMNTIFALSMVAGVGLTTGTPVIGARVAEEMWAAGRADTARSRTCEVAYQTARRAVPAPSYLNRKSAADTDHGLVTWRYVAYNGGKSRWGGVYCPPPQVPRSRSVRREPSENLPSDEQRHHSGSHVLPANISDSPIHCARLPFFSPFFFSKRRKFRLSYQLF